MGKDHAHDPYGSLLLLLSFCITPVLMMSLHGHARDHVPYSSSILFHISKPCKVCVYMYITLVYKYK